MYEKPMVQFEKYGLLPYVHPLDIAWGDWGSEWVDVEEATDIHGRIWDIVFQPASEQFGYSDIYQKRD